MKNRISHENRAGEGSFYFADHKKGNGPIAGKKETEEGGD